MQRQYTCIRCGRTFTAEASAKRLYCSRKCQYRHRGERLEEDGALAHRFWAMVDKGGDCWLWMGYRMATGYGQTKVGGRRGKVVLTHRLAWELTNGSIADGLDACHQCDNPPCCNPAHLFLGTPAENMADAAAKHRMHEGNAHGLRKHPERAASGARNKAYTHPETVDRGSQHWNAKTTEDEVREIRRLHKAGVSQKELAQRFSRSAIHIYKIVHRLLWKHVE